MFQKNYILYITNNIYILTVIYIKKYICSLNKETDWVVAGWREEAVGATVSPAQQGNGFSCRGEGERVWREMEEWGRRKERKEGKKKGKGGKVGEGRGGKTGTYTRPVYNPRVPVTRLAYTQTRPV